MVKYSYAKSGVDIHKEAKSISSLISQLTYKRVGREKKIHLEEGYSGLIDFGDRAIAITTDGVGTKILIAELLNKWDTIGIDCVAMNVNDLIAVGAEPIAMVDYIATEEVNEAVMAEIGVGLNEGARQANIDIVGGETATLKGKG